MKDAIVILVQGAMEIEVEELILALEDVEEIRHGAHTFYSGYLPMHRVKVIVSRTYIGMVNCTAATVLGIEHFAPDVVINQGLAGSHDPQLRRGNIVIGTQAVNMGALVSSVKDEGQGRALCDYQPRKIEVPLADMPADAAAADLAGDVVSDLADEAVTELIDEAVNMAPNAHVEKDEMVQHEDFPFVLQRPVIAYRFYADKRLLEAAHAVKLMWEKQDKSVMGRVFEGPIGSAETWNSEKEEIRGLSERLGTIAEEMEGAAAAQICQSYGIPYIGVRLISNSEWTGEEYEPCFADDCQRFVMLLIEEIAKRRDEIIRPKQEQS